MQHDDLQCRVTGLHYDFDEKIGVLLMAPGDCCDMAACTKLFEGIDAAVKVIFTQSGSEPDTMYRRDRRGLWEALSPPPGLAAPLKR